MYTKYVTAAVSSQLKSMLHLNSANTHHEYGQTRVARDAEMVLNEMVLDGSTGDKPIYDNKLYINQRINRTTGQQAEQEVEHRLNNVKELGPGHFMIRCQLFRRKYI